MAKKGYTPEQIINKLREAEILLSQRNNIGEVSRKIGVKEPVVSDIKLWLFT
ncbi:hypothetical protein ACFLXY_10720 [Chloroflexota bacterium]